MSTMLLRLAGGEYLLLNKWMTKSDAQAWLESPEHKNMEKLATETSGFERLERSDATLVHQLFGAHGRQGGGLGRGPLRDGPGHGLI